MRVPTSAVGEVGKGFRYVIDGCNAERILLPAEAIGDGYSFTKRGPTSNANFAKPECSKWRQ